MKKSVLSKFLVSSSLFLLASCGSTTASSESSQPLTPESSSKTEASDSVNPASDSKLVNTFIQNEYKYVLEYEGSSYSYEMRTVLDVYDDGSYMFVYYNQQIVTDSDTNYGNFQFASFGSYTKVSADPDDDECAEFVYTLSLPERLIFTDNWNWGAIKTYDSADGEMSVADIIKLQAGLYYNFSFISFAADISVKADTALGLISNYENLESTTTSTLKNGGAFAVKDVYMNVKTQTVYEYEGSSYTYDARYFLRTFADNKYMFTYMNQRIVTDSWTDYGSLIRTTFGSYTKVSMDPDDEECTEFTYTLGDPIRVIFSDAWNWGTNATVDTADGEKSIADVSKEASELYYNFLYWPATNVIYVVVDEAVCSISWAYGASLNSSVE